MPEIAHTTENYGEIKKFMALSWRAAQLSGVSPTDFVKLAKEFSGAISVSENSIDRIYTIDPDPPLRIQSNNGTTNTGRNPGCFKILWFR